jgi:hypothetical protein
MHRQNQNPSMPLAAWWCLVAVGIAACGVTLGDFPTTISAALLFVMIVLVPGAVMLVLWRAAPQTGAATLVFAEDRARVARRRTRA